MNLRCAHCGQYLGDGHALIDRSGRVELVIRHVCPVKSDDENAYVSSTALPVEQNPPVYMPEG